MTVLGVRGGVRGPPTRCMCLCLCMRRCWCQGLLQRRKSELDSFVEFLRRGEVDAEFEAGGGGVGAGGGGCLWPGLGGGGEAAVGVIVVGEALGD